MTTCPQIPRPRTDRFHLFPLEDAQLCRLLCHYYPAPSTCWRTSRRRTAVLALSRDTRNVHTCPPIGIHSRPRSCLAAMDPGGYGHSRRTDGRSMATSFRLPIPAVLETIQGSTSTNVMARSIPPGSASARPSLYRMYTRRIVDSLHHPPSERHSIPQQDLLPHF